MRQALGRVVPVLVFAVLPVAVVVTMLAVAVADDSLAVDFHNELYPEAKLLLDGVNPFPPPGTELGLGHNRIWPPVAGYLVAPLTLLGPAAADWTIAVLGIACLLLALRVVGVRDWRVYGAFTLWPQAAGELRVAHLTPLLCLLVAIAWRYRHARFTPGLAVGLGTAVKFFLWPVGVWLAAIGRARETAAAAALVASSLLLVLPFTGLDEYVRTLLDLSDAFDEDTYTPTGYLIQIGVDERHARLVGVALGAALLVACWRRASLALALAAALVLSPIVWLDYYALAAVPLAVVRPRLSAIWLAPIATWGMPIAGVDTGNASDTARLLVVFAVVFTVVVRAEGRAGAMSDRPPATGQIQREPASA